jgi:hypothetical protein
MRKFQRSGSSVSEFAGHLEPKRNNKIHFAEQLVNNGGTKQGHYTKTTKTSEHNKLTG